METQKLNHTANKAFPELETLSDLQQKILSKLKDRKENAAAARMPLSIRLLAKHCDATESETQQDVNILQGAGYIEKLVASLSITDSGLGRLEGYKTEQKNQAQAALSTLNLEDAFCQDWKVLEEIGKNNGKCTATSLGKAQILGDTPSISTQQGLIRESLDFLLGAELVTHGKKSRLIITRTGVEALTMKEIQDKIHTFNIEKGITEHPQENQVCTNG